MKRKHKRKRRMKLKDTPWYKTVMKKWKKNIRYFWRKEKSIRKDELEEEREKERIKLKKTKKKTLPWEAVIKYPKEKAGLKVFWLSSWNLQWVSLETKRASKTVEYMQGICALRRPVTREKKRPKRGAS